jgi:hypothetical protein
MTKKYVVQSNGKHSPLLTHMMNKRTAPPEPVQEPPQYSLKAHWTDDKRIGVVACVTRPDGGVHLIQTIIDPPPPVQEPWGACVSGRVFVGALPEHIRKLTEDDGLPIQLLYTAPPQRKPLTDEEIDALANNNGTVDLVTWWRQLARAIEAAHGIKEGA